MEEYWYSVSHLNPPQTLLQYIFFMNSDILFFDSLPISLFFLCDSENRRHHKNFVYLTLTTAGDRQVHVGEIGIYH